LQKIKHAEDFGISSANPSFDIKKIVERSRDISAKLVGGIKGLLKKNKITVFEGIANITNPKLISVEGRDGKISIETKNIIIATGARPRILDGFKPDGKNIWTYKEALVPKSVPKSMIIVGSGAIGIEFASCYNALGVQVTVLEAAERILPAEDAEISTIAKKLFDTKGIKFYTGVKLKDQKKIANKLVITFSRGSGEVSLDSEILLMAVGIVANTENLGLENTQIKLDRGHIETNGFAQTAESNIYAIGDVAGAPWLAHKASHEGVIAAEHIAGKKPHKLNKLNIPGCTYSSPQIASVGMTEEAASLAGYQLKIGRFPFYANGKAMILGDSDGLIKTIFDVKTGELLGAHMIGSDVTELIHGYVIAKSMEGTELDLMGAILPHPTLSEMLHESVLQAYGRQIHI
jgi:dihydrolipoamide dehydrogenase